MVEVHDPYNFAPLVDPKYLVLGYLQEYMGRDIGPDQDEAAGIDVVSPTADERLRRVETFFPSEESLVDGFCEALTSWAAITGVELRLEVERGPQGHVTVLDPAANRLINSCYASASRVGLRGELGIHEGMFPEWPPVRSIEATQESVDARFSFLLGCHRRFGAGAEFLFSNSTHKLDLVVAFLQQIGCEWLETEWWTQTVPRLTKVRFTPSHLLAEWLEIDREPPPVARR